MTRSRFNRLISIFRDRRGIVFVLFSLILPIAMSGFLGMVSLYSMSTGRADLQLASDAAANAILADLNAALTLSATPDALVVDLDKQARADSVVQSILGRRQDVTQLSSVVTTTPETISVTVSAQFSNVVGDLFNLPFFTRSATTTANWLRSEQLQIALAIDAGTTNGKSQSVSGRLSVLKPLLTATIDMLSAVPNYPDIAISMVPFTAQVVADPVMVVAGQSDHADFSAHLNNQVAHAVEEFGNWMFPSAHAALTACYSDPIVPSGVDGSVFGGVNRPLPKPCASNLPRLRQMVKISRPYVKGKASIFEAFNAPAKLARDDIKAAINAISPSGCRNLTMGLTWSLAQLPTDSNPKIIFMIVNGNNSQNSRMQTSECSSNGVGDVAVQTRLDQEFVAACDLVRDPRRNKSRRLDLIVLQAVDGNPVALSACASSVDGTKNYFNSGQITSIPTIFQQLNLRLFQIAQKQKFNPLLWSRLRQ